MHKYVNLADLVKSFPTIFSPFFSGDYLVFNCKHRRRYSRERATQIYMWNSDYMQFSLYVNTRLHVSEITYITSTFKKGEVCKPDRSQTNLNVSKCVITSIWLGFDTAAKPSKIVYIFLIPKILKYKCTSWGRWFAGLLIQSFLTQVNEENNEGGSTRGMRGETERDSINSDNASELARPGPPAEP